MPPRPLLLSLAASLALHAAALGGGVLRGLLAPAPPARLSVSLPPLAEPPPAEALVKNTLAADETKPEPPAPPSLPPEPKPAPKTDSIRPALAPDKAAEKKRERPDKPKIDAAQRKLAEHTYYPPEAIARGIEGTVQLLIVVGENGRVTDVQLAASSGHTILDNAAIRAAYAMGSLPGVPAGELIRPVIFQLK